MAGDTLQFPAGQSPAERIRLIREEARTIAKGQVAALVTALMDAAAIAAEVVANKEFHAPGVVDIAQRAVIDLQAKAENIGMINARVKP